RLTGSYAGAFGATQFMPSSYRAYAVDADGDGKRDVWHSAADIIASVAHYFHRHGWQHGRPVACWLPWRTSLTLRAKQGLRAFTSLRSLRSALPDLPDRWRDTDQVAVIAVVMREGEQRMALVHRNFYVITRWNRSYHYALACSELAARLGCVDCRVAEV
ncbi:MAG: lytic murein transglycosylase, partial [Zetaproteobacteria bacterium]